MAYSGPKALLIAGAAAILLPAGCGGAPPEQTVGPPERRVLTEAQAISVIESALYDAGASPARSFPVQIEREKLIADIRLAGTRNAIEWVSDEDRLAEAAGLPTTRANGPLRIVTGLAEEANDVQVLVLDSSAYGYEGNPRLVQRGAPGIDEIEDRLRRDVKDYLEYLRVQGAL